MIDFAKITKEASGGPPQQATPPAKKPIDFGLITAAVKASYDMSLPGTLNRKAWEANDALRAGMKSVASTLPSDDPQRTAIGFPLSPGTPRMVADVASDFVPDMVSPTALALEGVGPLGGTLYKKGSKAAALGIRKGYAALPEGVPKKIVRSMFSKQFFQPKAWKDAADLAKAKGFRHAEEAADIGRALSTKGLSAAEKQREMQIVKGSISVSEKELPLRLRAQYARQKIDQLEKGAKALGLVADTALNRLTKPQRAALRNRQEAIFKRITSLQNFGEGLRQKLLNKASTIGVSGTQGLQTAINKTGEAAGTFSKSIPAATEELGARTFKGLEDILAADPLRRNRGVQKLIERFQHSSLADQEQILGGIYRAAERLGVKINKLDTSNIKPTNVRGLISQIQNASFRFPGQAGKIRALEQRSAQLQKRIVDSYRSAGQQYVPRLYLPEEGTTPPQFSSRMMKIVRDRFKSRKDIPIEARMAMGEIVEPAYPVAKGIAQTGKAVEMATLFNKAASNPRLASSVEREGFVRLPKNETLGSLSNKWVHPEVARDIDDMMAPKGTFEKIWDAGLGAWKFSKVVANPATWSRNFMTTSIINDMGGFKLTEQAKYLPEAMKQLRNKGPAWQEVKNTTLLGREFYGGEIERFQNTIEALKRKGFAKSVDKVREGMDKMGAGYGAIDQSFKLARYMSNRAKGMPFTEAVKDAEKWGFNYGRVSPAVGAIRKSPIGAPFITFTAKMLPRVAEGAITNPLGVAKYKFFLNALENTAKERLNLSDAEIAALKKNARGNDVVILPARDKDGKPIVWDISYLKPWGDVAEQGANMLFSSPLRTGAEMLFNKSLYMKRPIYNELSDTPAKRAAALTDYAYKGMMPALAPGVPKYGSPIRGGYSFEKLAGAFSGKPEHPFQDIRSKKQAILDAFLGLKTYAVDPAEATAKQGRMKEFVIREIEKQIRQLMRSKGLSMERKGEIVKEKVAQIQEVIKK